MLTHSTFIGFVPVSDASVARSFYETTLGLRVIEDTPFALVVDANGTTLRITPVGDFTPQAFTIAGWEVADIEATATALTAGGVTFRRYEGMEQDTLGIWTSPSGDRVAWFADPDDNTLSLTAFVGR